MVVLFSFGMCLFSGCGTEKEGKRGKDLDYTVVPTEECPADFLAEINKKKINPFHMKMASTAIWRLATESRKPTVFRCVSLASMKKATGWCLRRIF